MATPINIIRGWFSTNKKPTQSQFWDTWDSFWHKDEIIPQASIEDLPPSLNLKADKNGTLSFKGDIPNAANLNDYVGTGLYLQGANVYAAAGSNYPIPEAGQLEVVANQDFIYQKYHAYGPNNEIFYRTYYSPTGWFPWKKIISENGLINLNPEIVSDFNAPIGFKLLEGYLNAANRPSPGTAAWAQGLQVSTNSNPDYINQLLFDQAGNLYTRTKQGVAWNNWDKIATTQDLAGKFDRHPLTYSAIDCNIASEGIHTGVLWSNAPSSNSVSILENIVLSADWISQTFTIIGGQMYKRFRHLGTTWTEWKKILTDTDNFRHLMSYGIVVPTGATRWVKLFTTSSENNLSSRIECNMTSANSVNGFTIDIRGGYYDATVPSQKPFIEVTNGTYNERLKEVMVLKESNRFAVYILVRADDYDVSLFWNLDSVDIGPIEVNNAIVNPGSTVGSFVLPSSSFVKANNHGYTQLKNKFVGIGTSNPVSELDVYGNINMLEGYNLTWGGKYENGHSTIAATDLSMNFYPGAGDEKVRFQANGNVGIGTTNPSHKLVVSNNGNEGFEVAIGTGSEYVFLQNYNRTAGHYSPLIYDASVHVFHEGDVGINTFAPKAKLHIADGPGGAQLAFNRGSGGALFGQAMNEDGLILYKGVLGPSVYQRWHQSGNTSIGTHNDDGINKLQVDGSGKFEGTVSIETPTAPEHAATKAYVDDNAADRFIKVVDYYEISESDFGLSGSVTFFIDATTTDITMILPATVTDGRTIHFFRIDTTGHNVKVIANHLGGWNGNPSNDAIYLTGLDKQAIGKSFAGIYWQVQ